MARSSLRVQPHVPQTFAAFSNAPVSHTVVATFHSSEGESAPRLPLKILSRNGVSHPLVVLHCPHRTDMRAVPNVDVTSMPMRLVRLSRLPSDPVAPRASAIRCSFCSNTLRAFAIASAYSSSSTFFRSLGVRTSASQISVSLIFLILPP